MNVLRKVLFTPGIIAEREKCYDRLNPLRKLDINPIFTAEKSWEAGGIAWGSVLKSKIDGTYKFFYSTTFPITSEKGTVLIDNSELGSKRHVCCYAESDDGVAWRRPALNLMYQQEFPDNNIIWQWPGYFNDSLSVIEDTIDPDPNRRYKMLIYHHDNEDPDLSGGFPHVSPDGLRWERTGVMLPTQDAECLWQDENSGRYFAFLKDRIGSNRSRLMSYSDDFDNWSEPRWIVTPDHGDHAGTNFYNQTAFTMCDRILGFLNVYDVATQTSWLELAESPDGLSWQRMPSRSRLLQPSGPGSLDGGGAYPGLGVPILMGDEYWFYYYASPGRHDEGPVEAKPTLCVATFAKDRLVGQQTEGEGSFSTIPVLCPGGRLKLNVISKDPVTVALKRPGYGGEIEGFTHEECVPVTGDMQDGEIRWKENESTSKLKDRYVRIAVRGKNALIYHAEFVE
jgi:hypothetical protein